MTLCAAWVRQVDENEELVFATDSALTGDLKGAEAGADLQEEQEG